MYKVDNFKCPETVAEQNNTGVTGQIIPLPRLYPGVYSRLAHFNPQGIE
jgi:hypothetical protein